jgi:hypothetical protein
VAKPRKKSQQKSKSAIPLLLILLIVLAIIAGFFFEDYRSVPYGWFISIIWLTAGFFSLAFAILYFGQFILPHHEGESWLEGVAMMLRGATRFRPPPTPTSIGPEYAGQDSLPPSFNSMRAGVLSSHQVLATSKGTQFVRAAGPGFVRLKSGESVAQVVDLRKHVRSQDVTVNTRDGIPIVTSVKVVFRVKQAEQNQARGQLEYPYDKSSIFQVSQAVSIDEQHELLPWMEQITPQAASYLVSEVAQFTLNELSHEPALFNGIQRRVRRQLRSNFDGMGIKIFDVGVSMRELPEAIVQQRLAIWRAPWQSQIRVRLANSDANSLRRTKRARANAQVEIIQNIMQNIDEMRRAEGVALPQVVTLRIIEALGEAVSSNNLKTHIPGQVLAGMAFETSNLMDSLITLPAEEEEGDN